MPEGSGEILYSPVNTQIITSSKVKPPTQMLKYSERGNPYKRRSWNKAKHERTSKYHYRSTEDKTLRDAVIWTDGNGIYFGARNFKGIPTEEPYIRFDIHGVNHLMIVVVLMKNK